MRNEITDPDFDAARPRAPIEGGGSRSSRAVAALVVFVLLCLGLRVAALGSDPYSGISWDTGLFSDEGFYIHNARNVVLFGRMRTDQFNNALLMPTLHLAQVAVFKAFGVGAIQARMISVVLGLLTLPLFFGGLRRAFGAEVAAVGTLFLGLDHINLIFNRMALMDTPAAFVLVAAFYAFVRGIEANEARGRSAARWMALCGLLLAVGYATRGLAAILFPAPFLALWRGRDRTRKGEEGLGWTSLAKAALAGLILGMALYAVCWYLPNRAEIARVNRYHVVHQLLPQTGQQLRVNLAQALWGTRLWGQAPYLFRHSPVQFTLALCWLTFAPFRKRFARRERIGVLFCLWWLFGAMLAFSLANYGPSRYFPLFYPAMACLSALALCHLASLAEVVVANRAGRVLLCAFLAFQAARMLYGGETPREILALALWTLLGGGIGSLSWPIGLEWLPQRGWIASVLGIWLVVNGGWTLHWLTHLTYVQRENDAWLARNLPANSVLIGDCAPGLCLNNRFPAVNVIPDLCNDDHPIEKAAPSPSYVVILDGIYKEPWWLEHYPEAVAEARRVHFIPNLVNRPIGIYGERSGRLR